MAPVHRFGNWNRCICFFLWSGLPAPSAPTQVDLKLQCGTKGWGERDAKVLGFGGMKKVYLRILGLGSSLLGSCLRDWKAGGSLCDRIKDVRQGLLFQRLLMEEEEEATCCA